MLRMCTVHLKKHYKPQETLAGAQLFAKILLTKLISLILLHFLGNQLRPTFAVAFIK